MLALLLFSVVFNVVFYPARAHEEYEQPDFTKTNVVIFFTNPDIALRGGVDDAGISFLKFPVQGLVQSADDMPDVYKKLFSIDSKSAKCEQIFDKCLMNLIEWASNVKHMVTATVSTSQSKLASSIDYKFNGPDEEMEVYRYTVDQQKKNIYNEPEDDEDTDSFRVVRNPDIFGQLPLKRSRKFDKRLPALKFENYLNDFPIITAFNPLESSDEDRSFYDTDEQDSEKNPKPIPIPVKFVTKESVEPVKKIVPVHKMNKLSPEQERMVEKNTKDIINAFDIFSRIRDMFLGSFFTPNAKHSRSSFQEENSIDPSILGTVEARPLYDLVRYTLPNLQSQTCHFESHGYLLVIMGGNLSEIANPFSDLVQSVKYVLEHTDRQDTLLLVSCFCPRVECPKRKVPFYAQGPNSEEIKKSYSTVDLFENVRNALTPKQWSKIHSGGTNKYPITENKSKFVEDEYNSIDNEVDEDNHVIVGGGRMVRSASSAQRSTSTNIVIILICLSFLHLNFFL